MLPAISPTTTPSPSPFATRSPSGPASPALSAAVPRAAVPSSAAPAAEWRSAPSLLTGALVALNVAALAFGPLVLVRPVPAGVEDLARLTWLLVALSVLGGAIALTRAGVGVRIAVSGLLGGTAATGVHVAAYTLLGTAGRSAADFWSLGLALTAGAAVAVWIARTAAASAPSGTVLGGLAVSNAVAAVVMGAAFLGSGWQ